MTSLQTRVITDKQLVYDGTALSAHWIYRSFDILGDSLVAFLGEARVSLDHMVDVEDVKKRAPIYSPLMLHFIGEWFEDSLDLAILRQNLLIRNLYEALVEGGRSGITRDGNDLFYQARKLSVSIATRSPVSCLVHTGMNVKTEGTPVPTSGLSELGIVPLPFAAQVLDRFRNDSQLWRKSRVKVSPRA